MYICQHLTKSFFKSYSIIYILPTGALDYVTGKAVLKLLYDLSRRRNATVVIITHNQAIAPMADRIIRIRSGKILSNEVNDRVVPVDEIEW